jgi:hypothetical protein
MVEVASVDNAEAAEKLARSFKRLWPAEYGIKQPESVDQNPLSEPPDRDPHCPGFVQFRKENTEVT